MPGLSPILLPSPPPRQSVCSPLHTISLFLLSPNSWIIIQSRTFGYFVLKLLFTLLLCPCVYWCWQQSFFILHLMLGSSVVYVDAQWLSRKVELVHTFLFWGWLVQYKQEQEALPRAPGDQAHVLSAWGVFTIYFYNHELYRTVTNRKIYIYIFDKMVWQLVLHKY